MFVSYLSFKFGDHPDNLFCCCSQGFCKSVCFEGRNTTEPVAVTRVSSKRDYGEIIQGEID